MLGVVARVDLSVQVVARGLARRAVLWCRLWVGYFQNYFP